LFLEFVVSNRFRGKQSDISQQRPRLLPEPEMWNRLVEKPAQISARLRDLLYFNRI
jgi:hypothetical protein